VGPEPRIKKFLDGHLNSASVPDWLQGATPNGGPLPFGLRRDYPPLLRQVFVLLFHRLAPIVGALLAFSFTGALLHVPALRRKRP